MLQFFLNLCKKHTFLNIADASTYFSVLSEYLIFCMIFIIFAKIVYIKLAKIVKKKKLKQQRNQVVSPSSIEISNQDKKDNKKYVRKINEHFQ